jgi:hypothetical protein
MPNNQDNTKDLKISSKTKNFKFNTTPSKILAKQLEGGKLTNEDEEYEIIQKIKELHGSHNAKANISNAASPVPTSLTSTHFTQDKNAQKNIFSTTNKFAKPTGRPPKPESEKFTKTISLTFTEDDFDDLKQGYAEYCQQNGKYSSSFTNYLRLRMLSSQF